MRIEVSTIKERAKALAPCNKKNPKRVIYSFTGFTKLLWLFLFQIPLVWQGAGGFHKATSRIMEKDSPFKII